MVVLRKTLKTNPVLLLSLIGLLFSCQTVRYAATNRDITKEIKKSSLFSEQFTGFTLYNPETARYLCNYNDGCNFTPASNTKILTAFASLQVLGDSLPSYTYFQSGDSIFLTPFADPTFLHPAFPEQKAFNFLQNKNVFIEYPDARLPKYGPGWAWEDYQYGFQPERSWFPIYGNVVRIFNECDSMSVVPSFFKNYTQVYLGEKPGNLIYREEKANIFGAWLEADTSSYQRTIPFIYDTELLARLLEDTLGLAPLYLDSIPPTSDTLFSQPTKQVVTLMMLQSDNFLAEQLLIQSALMSGYMNVNSYRAELLTKWSAFLPDEMKWVDASGLSRYNLISPRNLVGILNQLYINYEWELIESIFPVGGVSGTLRNYYPAAEPYVFAKTGTLSNNHNLSGYLKTKSGKMLIFSLMNNHYTAPTDEVKAEMEKILSKIRDAY